MSELPDDARDLLTRTRVDYEPDAARLARVAERVRRAAATGSPRVESALTAGDAPLSGTRLGWPLRLVLGGLVSGLMLASAVLWSATTPAEPTRGEQTATGAAPSASPEPATNTVMQTPNVQARAPLAKSIEPATASQAASPPIITSSNGTSSRPRAREPRVSTRSLGTTRTDKPASTPDDPFGSAFDLPRAAEASRSVGDAAATPSAEVVVRRGPQRLDDGSLAREVALISAARRALERSDITTVEARLHEHAASFPVGQFHAERIALATRARCVAGDGAAARKLYAQLLLVSQQASLRASVQRACGHMLVE